MMRLGIQSRVVASMASTPASRGGAVRAMSSKFVEPISTIPTMYYQDSLPRMPIPDLDATLDKYLLSASALVSGEQLEATKKVVEDFRGGVGKRLQFELKLWDDAHTDTSYISAPWYDMYLENPVPLPLYHSPQLTWKDDEDSAKMDQAARAANILSAAARFCNSLRAEVLTPDIFHTKEDKFSSPAVQTALHMFVPKRFAFYGAAAAGSYALDMSQYAALFSTTRVPCKGKDKLVTQKVDKTFIVAQRGARFYKVHIMDPETGPLPVEQIEAQLRAVLADQPGKDEAPVGVMSAIDRDWAADLRPEFEALNKASVADLDAALFCLTLDDSAPEEETEISRLMLHGNGRNRWFEKSFHVVVAANGKAGINWEHAWGDGVAVLRFFEEVYKMLSTEPTRAPANASTFDRLEFALSPRLQSEIKKAEAWVDEFFAGAELEILNTDALRKGDLKRSNLSPDGTMQMVLQLAHQRMHGYTPSTYESASMAAFKHGRTETIRSATIEANEFVARFQDPACPAGTRMEALRAAVARHREISTECSMGKGFDRHLFGLRHIAKLKGFPEPDFYSDPTYLTMADIRLSTSTLTSDAISGGGFGPIHERAYSCGYGILDQGSRFHIMTNKLGTKEFVDHIASAVADIRQAIDDSQ